MTTKEWNEGIEFLETADEGCWIENSNRRVEIVNMIGGRFLCFEDDEVCKLCDEEWRAMSFLKGI